MEASRRQHRWLEADEGRQETPCNLSSLPHRGHSQPNLVFSPQFYISLPFFFFFSQRKMVSSEAWCEKRVARGGVGLGSVRGEGLAGFALPKLLSAGPGSSPPASDTVGAQ